MLKHILPLVPKHKLYTEAFCGGATLLFAKEPAEGEVINDINMHLVNFYNTLQLDYDALKKKIDSTLHARDMHAHASHILAYPEFFSHVDRAWAVWALSKMSFASMLDGTFGYDFSGGVAKKVRNAKEEFCQHLDCGHYEGVFGNDDLGHLLDLLAQVKGMFMLTMFPHDLIASYAEQHNWTIHRIERFISASKTSRRKQEEWMVCNYEAPNKEQLLF